jgi:hypothetical protein
LLIERHGWHKPNPHNERPHTDEELKARIVELHGHGHSSSQIAAILNEQHWVPLKAQKFTRSNVQKLIRSCDEVKLLTPRRYLENLLEKMQCEHERHEPEAPFHRPGYPTLAKLLTEAGYGTPKGHSQWWPAQVQQLLEGHFDQYYGPSPPQL